MVFFSISTAKNVMVSDSWLRLTRCLSSGNRAASLGYSPLIGRHSTFVRYPLSGSMLKITTELSPAFELIRYLKSEEKLSALAAEPVA